MNVFSVVGKDHTRIDAEAKVKGTFRYTNDINLANMLHCKVLRSPYPHALVTKIDTTKAKNLSGVKAVITPWDVEDNLVVRAQPSKLRYKDAHILEKEVRFIGDRVAAVAASSLDIAEEAISLIDVEYEYLPFILDTAEAMRDDAPLVHQTIWFGNKKVKMKNNVQEPTFMEIGNIAEGFNRADVVIEREYKTGKPHNAPMGRPACICNPTSDGRLEVWNQTQSIHITRMNLAETLGIPLNSIKVIRMPMGGAFGYYIFLHLTDAICAFLALTTGLPVKLEETREEMFYDGGRHPAVIKLKTGVTRNGELTAMQMSLIDGTGAYSVGPGICRLECGWFMSMYRCPNKQFSGYSVYTNTPPLSAMRGAGNPQIHFVVESQMDIMAKELNIDPLEFRLKNHLRVGDMFYGQSTDITGRLTSCGIEEIAREGAKRIGWNQRKNIKPHKEKPWIKNGKGVAFGFHTSGAATDKPTNYMLDYSGAIVKMNEDGTANLTVAAADNGAGNLTALATIAAEEIGLNYKDIIVTEANTDNALFECWIHASRCVYSVGRAVKEACRNAKTSILDWAAKMLEVGPELLDIKNGQIYTEAKLKKSISVREVLEYVHSYSWGNIIGTVSTRAPTCPPHFVVTFIEVEVNTLTGQVKITKAVQGADVGTPINPSIVHGQLNGGLHMGIGYALSENVVYDSNDGRVLNPNFRDYTLTSPLDMPEVETFLIKSYEPTGPFGAKGIGEGATNPVAPAVYNAVYNAIGKRIYDMPITPEKVIHSIRETGTTY